MFKNARVRVAGENPLSRVNLAFFAVIFSAVGAYFIINSFAATPTVANLWIDNAAGTHNCQRQDTAEVYSSAQAGNRTCTSIQAAVAACDGAKSDIIVMKAATYGGQSANTTVASPGCTVIAENSTTIGGLSLSGSRVEVQNVKATSYSSLSGSNNTWRNVEITGQESWVTFGGTNNKWIGGSLHDLTKIYGNPIDEPVDIFNATNALIDGVEFYNISYVPDSDVNKNPHLEIIRVDRGSTNTTIQNSYFHDNDENTGTIFFTQTPGTSAPSGITFYNNRFGVPGNGSTTLALNSTVPCTNVLIAYNTFLGGTNGVSCSSPTNVRWVGNVGSHQTWNCIGTFSYNVWQDSSLTKCGSTETIVGGNTADRFGTNLLGLGGSDGMHLQAGSPAIDKAETPGSGTICSPTGGGATTDVFGGLRPFGSRCDAGAHEYGSTPGGGSGGGDTGGGNSLYISPTGVDTNACSQAAPCRTINSAYAKANPGTTILVSAGSYGNNSVSYRSGMCPTQDSNGKCTNPVIIKPVSGETVNFTDINMLAENITFQGPNFNARSFDIGCYNCTRIRHVTLDGLNIDAQDTVNLTGMNIGSVTDLVLKNSRVGNTMAGSGSSDTAKSVEFCGASSTCYAADVTFEGNTFYDADAPSGSLAHLECIFAPGIQGFYVKSNRFNDCTYFDIFITVILANNQAQPKDYIFEDNLFGRTVSVGGTESGYVLNMHSDVKPNNIQYLRNTIEGPIATANGGGAIQAGGWQIIGNIISEGVWLSDPEPMGCRSGITFAYNVMPNTCGTNTTTASTAAIKSGWVAQKGVYAGDDDFRLKATSPAVGKGRPSDAGTLDFAKIARGTPADAGAYAYTTGGTPTPKPGDTNGDNVVNIVDLSTLLSKWNTNFTAADFNKDNTVNIVDLSILLSNYGK